jgi:Flp pilus assembly pilin Flp
MPLPPALKVSLSSAVPCITGLSLTPKGKGVVMAKNISTQDSSARLKAQRGAGLIEYALLVALVSVVAISGVRGVGLAISNRFINAKDGLAGGAYMPPPDSCTPDAANWPDC